MNKQHFKNYFRGYHNKFREKLFWNKDDRNFYCTNLISVIKLFSSYDLEFEEGDPSNIKKFVDMFDEEYENYGIVDKEGHIFDNHNNPNLDYGVDYRKLDKIMLLLQGNEVTVVKRKDRDQFAIKIKGYNGYGYLLPIRNY